MSEGIGLPYGDISKEKTRKEWTDLLERRLNEEIKRVLDLSKAQRNKDHKSVRMMEQRLAGYRSETKTVIQKLHEKIKESFGQDTVNFKTFFLTINNEFEKTVGTTLRMKTNNAAPGEDEHARAHFKETLWDITQPEKIKNVANLS